MDTVRTISQTIHEILVRDPQWRWRQRTADFSTADDYTLILRSNEQFVAELHIGYYSRSVHNPIRIVTIARRPPYNPRTIPRQFESANVEIPSQSSQTVLAAVDEIDRKFAIYSEPMHPVVVQEIKRKIGDLYL